MPRNWTIAASIPALFALAGCDKFEASPYATSMPDMPEQVNLVNMARLAAREPFDDDTVTIVFTGEPQRFYEEQEAIVAKANSIPNVDLFILAGDIADFGLLQEFLWTHERMERLTMPWLAVVGNHDLQANGALIFQEFFGPLDFCFTYKGYKFLFHDTNGREYGHNGTVPRLDWLAAQMADTMADHFIGVSHVPPFNGDFDPALAQPYMDQLGSDPRTILSLHGHTGSYVDEHLNSDSVRYIVCNAMAWPEFLVLRIHNGAVSTQVMNYME
ncbi:MAG: metallophosphoesterase [Flavobacteriales bacterium]|nr:metallophosphoesterase [Flavobacteriales bacterium]MBP6391122.1 metallophosphoesterase [Flavobacteriales bacterium]MBP6698991.1 metallophosphoesterase [Flavobacteriales bacterium]